MHEDVKCVDPLPVKSSWRVENGILLGFSELFRKFYAAEEYSEVVKMFRRFILALVEGQNDSLELFLPGRALGTFLEDILLQ